MSRQTYQGTASKLLDDASLCVLTGSQSKVMLFAEALKATYDMR